MPDPNFLKRLGVIVLGVVCLASIGLNVVLLTTAASTPPQVQGPGSVGTVDPGVMEFPPLPERIDHDSVMAWLRKADAYLDSRQNWYISDTALLPFRLLWPARKAEFIEAAAAPDLQPLGEFMVGAMTPESLASFPTPELLDLVVAIPRSERMVVPVLRGRKELEALRPLLTKAMPSEYFSHDFAWFEACAELGVDPGLEGFLTWLSNEPIKIAVVNWLKKVRPDLVAPVFDRVLAPGRNGGHFFDPETLAWAASRGSAEAFIKAVGLCQPGAFFPDGDPLSLAKLSGLLIVAPPLEPDRLASWTAVHRADDLVFDQGHGGFRLKTATEGKATP
jgi:hypothetical protein